jgi:GTPase involved in cell partitioning and DNA repair
MFIEVSKVCVTPLETEDLSIVTKETINEIKKLQENLTKRNKSMVFKQFDKIASKAFLDLQKENLNDGGSEKVQ